MKKLIIIGAGGHAKVVYEIAKLCNYYQSIDFYDDYVLGEVIDGKTVIGNVSLVRERIDECDLFIAIGNNKIRTSLYDDFKALGATFALISHPSTIISTSAKIGENTVLMPQVVVNSCAEIGNSCIINTAATIDHDCLIEDGSHISVGSHIAGTCRIGSQVMLGVGSCVCNNVSIGDNVVVGAGGVVVKNIMEPGTYVGVPVKKIK